MKMLDADVFKATADLHPPGEKPRGHFVMIDTPDGVAIIRGHTGRQAIANALRWAADRNIELRIRVVTK